MRLARTIALLAMSAIAGLAFAANASAQDFEITNEANGLHCPAVTLSGTTVSGGCVVEAHSEGTVELAGHQFGIELHVDDCLNEFTARLNEDGSGYLTNQVLSGEGCTTTPCLEGGNVAPWPGTGIEASGQKLLRIQFCVVNAGTTRNCEFDVPFTANGHAYEFLANDLNGHTGGIFTARCELTGHWLTEADSPNRVEIAHI